MKIQATDPPWLVAAARDFGLREVAGPRSNPRIIEMYRAANHPAPETLDDTTWSWCSAAMCLWFEESKLPSTNSLMGRSWLKRKSSTRIEGMKVLPRGAVVVLKYDNDPNHGHVAILLKDNGKTLKVIGANQRNHVCEMDWARERLIGAIWPNERPMTQPSADVPTPKQRPELDAEPDDGGRGASPNQPDDPGVDQTTQEQPSFLRRWWLKITGAGAGTGGAGLLAMFTDWQVWVAFFAFVLIVLGIVIWIVGPSNVRAWIKRQTN